MSICILDLQLPMQSVPITTKLSVPTHGDMYSIQHYAKKFVSDLHQVGGVLRFPPSDRHDITEILLKVVLNTITLTLELFE